MAKYIERLDNTDREVRREATYGLMKLGPAAQPALKALLRMLDDPDKQVWSNSIAAIAAIGPGAADAIPKLIDDMDSRKARGMRPRDKAQTVFRYAYALTQIGDAARAPLISALRSDDTWMRLGAAKALGGMGPKAADAIPALIENLGNNDENLRTEAVEALGMIGEATIPALTQSLQWDQPAQREGSIRALAIIGGKPSEAAQIILKMATVEKEVIVRSAALAALPRLSLPQEAIIPVLIQALREDSYRPAAINALLSIRPASIQLVPALVSLLKEDAQAERAAYVLGRIGAEARSAVPALIKRARRSSPPPPAFVDAIIQIGAPAVPALLGELEKTPQALNTNEHWAVKAIQSIGVAATGELERALTSPTPGLRMAALTVLTSFGEDARDARDGVSRLVADAEPTIRAAALRAAVILGLPLHRAIEMIDAAARDATAVVRAGAADATAELGKEAAPLTDRILTLLDDKEPLVRSAALRAIGKIGGDLPIALEKLTTQIAEPTTRLAALEAIAGIGASATTLAPRLTELYPQADIPQRLAILAAFGSMGDNGASTLDLAVTDAEPRIRAAAVRSYAKARPKPEALVPILIKALGDGDESVRIAAAEAASVLGDRAPEKTRILLPPLIALMAEEDTRPAALEALRAMRVRDLEALSIALDSPSGDAKIWAMERVERIGKNAAGLAEKIKPYTREGSDYLRRRASRTLEAIR